MSVVRCKHQNVRCQIPCLLLEYAGRGSDTSFPSIPSLLRDVRLADNAVGECLLAAIKDVLGDGATDIVMEAWEDAYKYLADLFIELEKQIYEEAKKNAGYDGFKVSTDQQRRGVFSY